MTTVATVPVPTTRAFEPVEAIAAAVTGVAMIAGLHGGRFGEIVSYLPGRRITGVRVVDEAVQVHVSGRWPATGAQIAAAVRAAAAPYAGHRPVTVVVADLYTEGSS